MASMTSQGAKSLDAVTAVGAGNVVKFEQPKSNVSMQVTFTDTPTTASVSLEGSLDGVNFHQIAFWNTNSGNGGIVGTSGLPIVAARANLITLSGGVSPTVTALISAA